MTDSLVLPAFGSSIATNDVGGINFQVNKVDLGADGATSPLVRGQQTAAESVPVVLASDQTLALPTGAATSAKQDTISTALGSILTELQAKTEPGDTQLVSVGSIALPTGASTSAKQDTEIASLASIDGKITAVNTGAVVVTTSALPSGAATATLQTAGNSTLSTIAAGLDGARATRIDEGATYIYLGYADAGSAEGSAVWRISRFTIDNVSGLKWADGDTSFDNIWTNRASLTYS